MGIFANVIAFCMGRKPAPETPVIPEPYKEMTPAELKQAALDGDQQAELELRRRADATGK